MLGEYYLDMAITGGIIKMKNIMLGALEVSA